MFSSNSKDMRAFNLPATGAKLNKRKDLLNNIFWSVIVISRVTHSANFLSTLLLVSSNDSLEICGRAFCGAVLKILVMKNCGFFSRYSRECCLFSDSIHLASR